MSSNHLLPSWIEYFGCWIPRISLVCWLSDVLSARSIWVCGTDRCNRRWDCRTIQSSILVSHSVAVMRVIFISAPSSGSENGLHHITLKSVLLWLSMTDQCRFRWVYWRKNLFHFVEVWAPLIVNIGSMSISMGLLTKASFSFCPSHARTVHINFLRMVCTTLFWSLGSLDFFYRLNVDFNEFTDKCIFLILSQWCENVHIHSFEWF